MDRARSFLAVKGWVSGWLRGADSLRTAGISVGFLAGLIILTGCGSPSADDIARALSADGAPESVAECVAEQAVASDLSTDSLDRLAEEGITDDNGEDVQFLEDDTAILQALVTACLP